MQLDLNPEFGIPDGPDHWRLMVSGVVRQPYTPTVGKRMLIRMLGNVMDATEEQLASDEFVRRVTPFVADGAKKLSIEVTIGEWSTSLKRRTGRNGHFSQWLRIPASLLESSLQQDEFGRPFLAPELKVQDDNWELFGKGEVWLAESNGWTIITDIDDTIKESAIGDRRELLNNTFLRNFEPVEGMAGLYRHWAGMGAQFHYVSSSPCQLLGPLMDLRANCGFPGGSLDLRNFRLRNHVLKKIARIRRSGKASVVKQLVMLQPARQFLLIGDSGESDLELYARVARKFSERVRGIFIRALPAQEKINDRIEKVRQDLPPSVACCGYHSAGELAQLVSEKTRGLSSIANDAG